MHTSHLLYGKKRARPKNRPWLRKARAKQATCPVPTLVPGRGQPSPPGRLSQRFEDLLEERDEPNRKGPAVPPLTAKGALVGGAEPRLSHRPDQAPGSVPARGPGPGHHPQGANRKLGRELRIRHGEPSGCPVVRILLLSLPRAQVQSLLREIHSASQEAKKRNRKKKKKSQTVQATNSPK